MATSVGYLHVGGECDSPYQGNFQGNLEDAEDMYIFEVPSHVPGSLRVWCVGGSGGEEDTVLPHPPGGAGGRIGGYIDFEPGTELYFAVGSNGPISSPWESEGPYIGGAAGNGGFQEFAGGSASEVRTSTDIGDRIIVAGGGGGAGYDSWQDYREWLGDVNSKAGGDGGIGIAAGSDANGSPDDTVFGEAYDPDLPNHETAGATGGTLSAAGVGGESYYGATDGSDGNDGNGGDGATAGAPIASGGGGGGGYFGGGGGAATHTIDNLNGLKVQAYGGAGGSSWADTGIVTNIFTLPPGETYPYGYAPGVWFIWACG